MTLSKWLLDDRLHESKLSGQWRFEFGDEANTVLYANSIYRMIVFLNCLEKLGLIQPLNETDVVPPAV